MGVCSLAVALSDCRQIAGVSELQSASAACASCMTASCGDEEGACRESTGCSERLDCELACSPDDVSCRTGCAESEVGAAIGPVDACAETRCSAPCAHACGDLLPITPPASAQACAACVSQQCCDVASACGASAECRAGIECARAASVPDAIETCQVALHPTGTAASTALTQCVKEDCDEECAFGNDWSCLGAVAPPPATTSTIQGTLVVLNGSAQSDGVPGLQVRACYITDEACSSPETPSMTTDASGSVTLMLPTQSQSGLAGFLGYFEVTDPKGQYLTAIAIPGFPLTQTGFSQSFIVISLADAQTLAQAVHRSYDPTTGSLIVTATDCAYETTPGATYKLDDTGPETLLVYPAYGLPSLTTTKTDATGVAIVAFLPPGAGTVTASNDQKQITSKSPFFTRANAVTLLLAPPNQ